MTQRPPLTLSPALLSEAEGSKPVLSSAEGGARARPPPTCAAKALKAFREHYEVTGRNITDLEILLLARFYGVSFDVAARRCEDLGLLPRGAGFGISEQLKKQFGSPEKRAEHLGLPARQRVILPAISSHLAKSISGAIRRGDASIGYVTDRLGLSIGEVLAINVESSAP